MDECFTVCIVHAVLQVKPVTVKSILIDVHGWYIVFQAVLYMSASAALPYSLNTNCGLWNQIIYIF